MNQFCNNPTFIVTRIGGPVLLVLMLSACGGSYETGYASFSSKKLASDATDDTIKAVKSPLTDLGLMQDDIPSRLQALVTNPYTLEKGTTCDGLKDEMTALNDLLGPDIDSPKMSLASEDGVFIQGAGMVKDAAVGFVKSQVNILPMRSIIRQISGAKKHERHMARAHEAGKLRRAYIKGVAMAKFEGKCFIGPAVPVTEAKAEEPKHAEQEVASVE